MHEDTSKDEEKALKLGRSLQYTTIEDLAIKTEIIYDPDPTNTVVRFLINSLHLQASGFEIIGLRSHTGSGFSDPPTRNRTIYVVDRSRLVNTPTQTI